MLLIAGLLGMAAMGSVIMIGSFGEDEDGFDGSAPETDADDEALGAPEGYIEPDETALSSSEEVITGGDANDTLAGTDLASSISGGAGSDAIDGQGGDDTLSGDDGEDWIWAGDGDDEMHGGDDDDTLHGEAGEDSLHGDDGDDDLFGHTGDDTLSGGAGDDELTGGLGFDVLRGDSGDDGLMGGHDDDTLEGGAGNDTLFGGQGDDVLDGTTDAVDAPDYLNGNLGDDTILADDGDIVTGGAGADDIYLHPEAGQQVTLIDFDSGEDQLMIVVDDPSGGVEIRLAPDEADPGLTRMEVDGEEVALLRGADDMTLSDILLVSETEAAQYEVQPAAA